VAEPARRPTHIPEGPTFHALEHIRTLAPASSRLVVVRIFGSLITLRHASSSLFVRFPIAVSHIGCRRSICGGAPLASGEQLIQNRDIHALRFHEVHAVNR
jgi:hypothetical protein